jgi:uncharacterized protein YdeI (YjbR/CyaY-like superfamily)
VSAVHFSSAAAFRRWLKAHHSRAAELTVALHKKASGKGGMSYAQALDEALCFGWIDGVRHTAGGDAYTIRFTPRKPRSTWSRVNVRHARRLIAGGRMRPAGLAAFEARESRRTGIYSFEQRPRDLPAPLERIFRANKAAWAHWKAQPPGYRRTAIWWVVSAVREETRLGRLGRLIGDSAASGRLGLMA